MNRIRSLAAASAIAFTVSIVAHPSSAQLVVFDPNNYAQNVLTAARALQQINNQITSLQNQAQMLADQNLRACRIVVQQLQRSIQRPSSSIQARIATISSRSTTPSRYAQASEQRIRAGSNAQARWQTSVAALQDALRVQAGIVGNLDTNRVQMSALVTSSQSATGALQAAQAGNH